MTDWIAAESPAPTPGSAARDAAGSDDMRAKARRNTNRCAIETSPKRIRPTVRIVSRPGPDQPPPRKRLKRRRQSMILADHAWYPPSHGADSEPRSERATWRVQNQE